MMIGNFYRRGAVVDEDFQRCGLVPTTLVTNGARGSDFGYGWWWGGVFDGSLGSEHSYIIFRDGS